MDWNDARVEKLPRSKWEIFTGKVNIIFPGGIVGKIVTEYPPFREERQAVVKIVPKDGEQILFMLMRRG